MTLLIVEHEEGEDWPWDTASGHGTDSKVRHPLPMNHYLLVSTLTFYWHIVYWRL